MGIEDSTNFRRVSDTVTTSGSVGADDLRGLRSEGYDVVVNLLPDGGFGATPDEAAILQDQEIEYVHIPVDFASPTQDDFEAFTTTVDANEGRSIHIHCTANYRVSAFYGIYAVQKGWWNPEQADAHVHDLWDPAEHPAWDAFLAARTAPDRLPDRSLHTNWRHFGVTITRK